MSKKLIGAAGVGRSLISQIFGIQAAIAALFPPYVDKPKARHSSTAFQRIIPGIRNRKDPIKKAAIERRRKATRLAQLSKSKRRAVYYYNLRHPASKMYA